MSENEDWEKLLKDGRIRIRDIEWELNNGNCCDDEMLKLWDWFNELREYKG